jgi:DNA-binding NarL/FixJ family response regulator
MEASDINVLLVDNRVSEGSKIKTYLEQVTNPSVRVWCHDTRAESLHFLKENHVRIDAIILDLFIADPTNPKETYKLIKQSAEDIPIIVITDAADRDLACEVTAEGARDIVVRERFEASPQRLLDAIEFTIIRSNLLREMKGKTAKEIEHQKRVLHWMTGGYSVEAEAETIVDILENRETG